MTVLQLVNEKNPTSVRPTVEYIFYKATLGEIPRDVVERNKKKMIFLKWHMTYFRLK